MKTTDWVTLGIALYGAVVATLSAWVSYLAFIRGGSSVELRAYFGSTEQEVVIDVINAGRNAVQIVALGCQIDKKSLRPIAEVYKTLYRTAGHLGEKALQIPLLPSTLGEPKLPLVLSAEHTTGWVINHDRLILSISAFIDQASYSGNSGEFWSRHSVRDASKIKELRAGPDIPLPILITASLGNGAVRISSRRKPLILRLPAGPLSDFES